VALGLGAVITMIGLQSDMSPQLLFEGPEHFRFRQRTPGHAGVPRGRGRARSLLESQDTARGGAFDPFHLGEAEGIVVPQENLGCGVLRAYQSSRVECDIHASTVPLIFRRSNGWRQSIVPTVDRS